MKKLILFVSLLALIGCGGVSLISRGTEDLYTPEFTLKIERAKGIYAAGNPDKALAQLNLIKDESLLPSERAMKRNLLGVIQFSGENFEQAIYEFNLALSTSSLDRKLTAQIQLNLGSSYYKLGDIDKTMATLLLCDFKQLTGKDFENYHKLRYSIGRNLDQKKISVESLMWLLVDKKNLTDLKASKEYNELVAQYFALGQYERLRIVKDFSGSNSLISGYMTYLEVEQLFTQAKREEAIELVDWIEDKYEDNSELMELVLNFKSRMQNYASLNQFSIGVLLPLSGKKSVFGKRALAGIDHAIRSYNNKNRNTEGFVPIKLHVADTQGSNVVGKRRVKELIESNNVSLLIGGLFSSEAYAEYEASKQFGTFFISLSQIYTDKVTKDHLLVEIPGSVESQLSILFSEKFLSTFGRDGAIIYPNSPRGQAYVEEFWRRAQVSDAKVTNVHMYDRKKTDHRETIQKLLGLKFKRERLEELKIIKELHELEGNTSIRRIQDLKPEIDFDWAFVPSFPNEALQLIPSFSYYDAFDIPIIGDPSWRSKAIMRESHKLGRLYFVDSDVPKNESEFVFSYKQRYGSKPGLIEILGYEAFEVANNILRTGQYESREALEDSLKDAKSLTGLTGSWKLEDNIWIKTMNMMSLFRGKTAKMKLEIEQEEVKAE